MDQLLALTSTQFKNRLKKSCNTSSSWNEEGLDNRHIKILLSWFAINIDTSDNNIKNLCKRRHNELINTFKMYKAESDAIIAANRALRKKAESKSTEELSAIKKAMDNLNNDSDSDYGSYVVDEAEDEDEDEDEDEGEDEDESKLDFQNHEIEQARSISSDFDISDTGLVQSDEILGQGTFGTVRFLPNQPGVIVKKFKLDFTKKKVKQSIIPNDILSEAAVYHTINGLPNLMSVFDKPRITFTCDNPGIRLYLPQYKEDLETVMKRGGLSNKQKLVLMYKLSIGLYYLHMNNIVHADFKPANVMVNSMDPDEMDIAIIDYGLSHQLADTSLPTRVHSSLQTLWWKAPEVLFARNEIQNHSVKMDIFSLGIVFIEIMMGRCGILESDYSSKMEAKLNYASSLLKMFGFEKKYSRSEYFDFRVHRKTVFVPEYTLRKEIVGSYFGKGKMSKGIKSLLTGMMKMTPNNRFDIVNVLESSIFDSIRKKNYPRLNPVQRCRNIEAPGSIIRHNIKPSSKFIRTFKYNNHLVFSHQVDYFHRYLNINPKTKPSEMPLIYITCSILAIRMFTDKDPHMMYKKYGFTDRNLIVKTFIKVVTDLDYALFSSTVIDYIYAMKSMIPEIDHVKCMNISINLDSHTGGKGLSNLVKAVTIVKFVTGNTYGPDKYIDEKLFVYLKTNVPVGQNKKK
jgi:serine/threonine protein kinase